MLIYHEASTQALNVIRYISSMRSVLFPFINFCLVLFGFLSLRLLLGVTVE